MQIAVIEFARNVLNLEGAHSTEFDSNTPHPVIALVSEWRTLNGVLETRTDNDQMGGTLRLGAQSATLSLNSIVQKIYGQSKIQERHRHRYEFNNLYRTQFEKAGISFQDCPSMTWLKQWNCLRTNGLLAASFIQNLLQHLAKVIPCSQILSKLPANTSTRQPSPKELLSIENCR